MSGAWDTVKPKTPPAPHTNLGAELAQSGAAASPFQEAQQPFAFSSNQSPPWEETMNPPSIVPWGLFSEPWQLALLSELVGFIDTLLLKRRIAIWVRLIAVYPSQGKSKEHHSAKRVSARSKRR